jgi:hypothetical protein
VRAVVLGTGLLVLGTAARAHTVSADEVVAQLRAPALREAYGIVDVHRLDGLPRLLLVQVGERWRDVPAEQRRAAAEEWAVTWQHAVPQGIVSVVDGEGDAVVNFDALGGARLTH